METIFSYILVAVFGLIIASFLNVVIYRLHEKKSFIKGHSYCPKCQHALKAADLVPIFSFIRLKGRCRYCRQKISWQYPLGEALLALAFCLLFFYFNWSWSFVFYLIDTCFLFMIFLYDLKYFLILDQVSLPAIVCALIFSIIMEMPLLDLLLGGLIGGVFFLAQYVISRGHWIGGGDIRLGVLMGFILGWEKFLVALFLAYIAGSLVSLILIIVKRRSLKSQLAFAPFLVASTFITLLYGQRILDWYLAGNLVNWLLY
ncbi:MAG: prepilin peptidase [Patescibacteria group bacterium]